MSSLRLNCRVLETASCFQLCFCCLASGRSEVVSTDASVTKRRETNKREAGGGPSRLAMKLCLIIMQSLCCDSGKAAARLHLSTATVACVNLHLRFCILPFPPTWHDSRNALPGNVPGTPKMPTKMLQFKRSIFGRSASMQSSCSASAVAYTGSRLRRLHAPLVFREASRVALHQLPITCDDPRHSVRHSHKLGKHILRLLRDHWFVASK